MYTLDDLDRQMDGDASPAGLLYLTVGLVVGCGLILGGLLGALLGHFVLAPDFDLAYGTVGGAVVGAAIVATLGLVGLRAAVGHMLAARS